MGLVLVFRGTEAMAKLVQRGILLRSTKQTGWPSTNLPAVMGQKASFAGA